MRKLFCWMVLGLSAAGVRAAPEAAVRQVFRPERLEAGATNIKVVQPIDEAAWIWMKGEDVWGAEALAASPRRAGNAGVWGAWTLTLKRADGGMERKIPVADFWSVSRIDDPENWFSLWF